MGLFDKFKRQDNKAWENAYLGNPNFYRGMDGKPFGAYALTEGTLTALLKNPRAQFKVDNAEVEQWKLMLVSTTRNGVLGDTEYYNAVTKLRKFVIDENDKHILIRALSLDELKELLK